jgi:hypothetical protein
MMRTAGRKHFFRGKMPLLLAALLLVLSFALEFHHHEDGKPHRDCSLCAAVHQERSAGLSSPQPKPPVLGSTALAVPSGRVASPFGHRNPLVIRPPPA